MSSSLWSSHYIFQLQTLDHKCHIGRPETCRVGSHCLGVSAGPYGKLPPSRLSAVPPPAYSKRNVTKRLANIARLGVSATIWEATTKRIEGCPIWEAVGVCKLYASHFDEMVKRRDVHLTVLPLSWDEPRHAASRLATLTGRVARRQRYLLSSFRFVSASNRTLLSVVFERCPRSS